MRLHGFIATASAVLSACTVADLPPCTDNCSQTPLRLHAECPYGTKSSGAMDLQFIVYLKDSGTMAAYWRGNEDQAELMVPKGRELICYAFLNDSHDLSAAGTLSALSGFTCRLDTEKPDSPEMSGKKEVCLTVGNDVVLNVRRRYCKVEIGDVTIGSPYYYCTYVTPDSCWKHAGDTLSNGFAFIDEGYYSARLDGSGHEMTSTGNEYQFYHNKDSDHPAFTGPCAAMTSAPIRRLTRGVYCSESGEDTPIELYCYPRTDGGYTKVVFCFPITLHGPEVPSQAVCAAFLPLHEPGVIYRLEHFRSTEVSTSLGSSYTNYYYTRSGIEGIEVLQYDIAVVAMDTGKRICTKKMTIEKDSVYENGILVGRIASDGNFLQY